MDYLLPVVLIVRSGARAQQTFILREGVNDLGRATDNDIILSEPSVSPHHARLVLQPEGVWIQDLGSQSGTFVNGRRLRASSWLKAGDSIAVGPAVILRISQLPADQQIPADETLSSGQLSDDDQTSPGLAPFRLIVAKGPRPSQNFSLSYGTQTIGRANHNQIVIKDPVVSRTHAKLVVQSAGVWIEDLGSSNGTFINGQRLTAGSWIRPADTIQLGSTISLRLQPIQLAPAITATKPRSKGHHLYWLAAPLLLLLTLVGAFVAWRLIFPAQVVASPLIGPTIVIYEPEPNARVTFNSPLFIHASARDDEGVRRAELWVNGELRAARNSDFSAGINPFTFVPTWAPVATGEHRLTMRAYSRAGRPGESNPVSVNAVQVKHDTDHLIYIAEEADTLEILADLAETTVDELIVLNPQVVEIAAAEGVPPPNLEIPAGAPIVVPAGQPVADHTGPNLPVEGDSPPAPPDLAGAGDAAEPPVEPGCPAPAAAQSWTLAVTDFQSRRPEVTAETVYCHILLGPRGHSQLLAGRKVMDAPFQFDWPAVSPDELPVEFNCLAAAQPPDHPPLPLEPLQDNLNREQGLNGESVRLRGKDFELTYRVQPAEPADVAAAPVTLAAPDNLAWLEPWACYLYFFPTEPYFSGCLNGQLLTWRWPFNTGQPNPPVCFEIHEQIIKENRVASERVVSRLPAASTLRQNMTLAGGALVNRLTPARLECESRAAYFVRAIDSAGNRADSKRLASPVTGPPCARTATVTFERLRVLTTPGSDWERYAAFFFANRARAAWEDSPGLPQADNSYALGDYLADNSLTETLAESDQLNVGVSIAKIVNGRWEYPWCEALLVLNDQQLGQLSGQAGISELLVDPKGSCQIEVLLQVP